jgi:hypothetical protein
MKALRLSKWLLSCVCAIASTGCQKETAEPDALNTEFVAVSYQQTYCADKWGSAPGTQQLEAVATAYLTSQGIQADQLHARVKTQSAVCNACTCTTGLVLAGAARKADLPALLALGFTRQ